MNNTTLLVVQGPCSINPFKTEKEMTASLLPMLTTAERAVLYLKVPRPHPLVHMIKAVQKYGSESNNDGDNRTN
jgi:hypothetical protein